MTEIIEGARAETTAVVLAETTPRNTAIVTPQERVAQGTAIANQIADLIEKQKMYSDIQGKKYVKVDAWVGLGSMDGVFPRERDVVEHEDGSYEAYVELINKTDGRVIGGASAICGTDESRWRAAPKYARRSIAITRATGKAFRLHYSWVMCLAGYEPTPLEEMPEETRRLDVYTGTDSQRDQLLMFCQKAGLNETETDAVLSRMVNRPFRQREIADVLAEVKTA